MQAAEWKRVTSFRADETISLTGIKKVKANGKLLYNPSTELFGSNG